MFLWVVCGCLVVYSCLNMCGGFVEVCYEWCMGKWMGWCEVGLEVD